uniref:Ovule protein n=1 Tax=Parascaris univalens TaxID=6257 RepID=A0A915BXG3_PARUN
MRFIQACNRISFVLQSYYDCTSLFFIPKFAPDFLFFFAQFGDNEPTRAVKSESFGWQPFSLFQYSYELTMLAISNALLENELLASIFSTFSLSFFVLQP